MNHPKVRQVVPSLIMAGAAAVPVLTAVEILMHVPTGGSGVALQPPVPVAVAPQKTSGAARPSGFSGSGGTHTYVGTPVNQPYGAVQATVTATGTRISDVVITAPQDNPRSAGINQQAIPLLRSETLQTQSAQINLVSGATLTSEAYAQSLQSALDQAQRQGNAPIANPVSSQTRKSGSGNAARALSVSVHGDD